MDGRENLLKGKIREGDNRKGEKERESRGKGCCSRKRFEK